MTYVLSVARTDEDNIASKYKKKKRRHCYVSYYHCTKSQQTIRFNIKITEFMWRVTLPYFHWDCKVSDVTSSE